MKLFTIGFTKSKASHFFGRLNRAGVRRVIDTRLNRTSQLSGFAKEDDLRFFLKEVSKIEYSTGSMLEPTWDMLDAYRKKEIDWPEYARRYFDLISDRQVEKKVHVDSLDHVCLLCSEATPEHCHRRLAAEYLANTVPGISIQHL